MTEQKSPVEQALELFVFAPLGLAMTARTQLPEMVAKGRAQVEGQLTVARFIGQFAVQHGRSEVEKRLKAYTDRGEPSPEAAPEPEAAATKAAATLTLPVTVLAEPAPQSTPPAPAEPVEPVEPVVPPPPSGDLAIPGYDALSASQVVQRLAGLAPDELEQVRAYEAATRGRKTVLTKISQLQ